MFKLASSLGQLKRLVDILGKPAHLSFNVMLKALCFVVLYPSYAHILWCAVRSSRTCRERERHPTNCPPAFPFIPQSTTS